MDEYSIKLRMEKMSKSQIFTTFCLFISVFVLCVGMAVVFAPSIINSTNVDIYKCSNSENENCYSTKDTHEVWEGVIPEVSHLNQLLYLSVTPSSKEDIEFNMTMEIIVSHKTEVIISTLKQSLITCKQGTCTTILIFYMPYLEYSSYSIIIRHKSPILSDMIEVSLSYINAAYTKYQLGTKYVFFVLSLASFLYFFFLSKRIPFNIWSIETKLLLPLGCSLILFNEPLLFATIFLMNPFWSAVSVYCNTQFLAALLLFWSTDLQYYRKSSNSMLFIIINSILIATLFLLVFSEYLYLHQKLRYDPTYNWEKDFDSIHKKIFIGIICVSIIIFVWIVYLCSRAIKQLRKLNNREKMIKKLNVVAILFAFIGVGIGSFQSIPRTSAILLVFQAGFNLYVILLQILYSPTRDSLLEYEQDKKIEYSLVRSNEYEEFKSSEIELA